MYLVACMQELRALLSVVVFLASPQGRHVRHVSPTTTNPPMQSIYFLLGLTRVVAQYWVGAYPPDRSNCPSNDAGCIVGTVAQSLIFPIRTIQRPFISTPAGTLVEEQPRSYWLPPEGFEFDYTGNLVARAGEYVPPTEYIVLDQDEDATARNYYTGLTATVVINATGHFNPPHIGVQEGTAVTWVLDTYEDALVESVRNASNSSNSFILYSGRMNRNGGSARVTYNVSFGGTHEDVDAIAPPAGLFVYQNPFAWDVAWRRRDGVMHGLEDVPEARGSVLVRPLICSQLTECTACLLYVQCIWCAGNATCFARDVATNMPVDTGMILRAAPNPDWQAARAYNLLRYYWPTVGTYGLDWYPWPPVRSIPRPARDTDYPSGQVTPVSSDRCYACVIEGSNPPALHSLPRSLPAPLPSLCSIALQRSREIFCSQVCRPHARTEGVP